MLKEILKRIVIYSQTLNRKEDILTGIFATMLYFSPSLLKFIFTSKCLIKSEVTLKNLEWVAGESLSIATGYYLADPVLVHSDYIESDRQNSFIPDLAIYKHNSNSFNPDLPLILIESKINAPLTQQQMHGYIKIKEIMRNKCCTIMISNENSKNYKFFDIAMTWADLVLEINEFLKNDKTSISEKSYVELLLDLLFDLGTDFNSLNFTKINTVEPKADIASTKIFVKKMRKKMGMTQKEFAKKAGVGLRFLRELEQGKKTLRLDKLNQVLKQFDAMIGPINWDKRINE